MIQIMFCSGLFELAAVDELKRLTSKYGKTAIRAALDLEQPGRWYRTVGFRRPTEVIENLEAPGWEISDADTAEIDVIFDRPGAITLPPVLDRSLAHCVIIG